MIESSLRDLEVIQKILDAHTFIALGGDEVFRRHSSFCVRRTSGALTVRP